MIVDRSDIAEMLPIFYDTEHFSYEYIRPFILRKPINFRNLLPDDLHYLDEFVVVDAGSVSFVCIHMKFTQMRFAGTDKHFFK